MRFQLFLLVSVALAAVAACERPTGPELLARIDQADRDLLADTTGQRLLAGKFAGSWELIRLLPNGGVDRNLLAVVDGKEHWFKAFVFERVVIRLDSTDGYRCPLMLRELLAMDGGRQGFMLKGSDFDQPVRANDYCHENLAPPVIGTGAPTLWLERLNAAGGVGVSGSARVDQAARTGDCDFLKADRGFPLKVDCELRDYEVQLAVGLGGQKDDLIGRLSSPRFLRVSRQRVPGLRLVIHCSERHPDVVGGCESVSRPITTPPHSND